MKLAIEARISALTPDQLALLLERAPTDERQLRETVRDILDRVRSDGDEALFQLAQELDAVALASLEVPRERWSPALEALDPEERSGWERAARNIHAFHLAQIPPHVTLEIEPGVRLGRRVVPLQTVGIYAPGGSAAYPSSVLMGAVPAKAAGVAEIVVCSPPGPTGEPPEAVLAACEIAGATRLFALGGAGAVGAMAFGTETVPRADAVMGPGSQWVTEAKRQVAGNVRIDSPAGPSEVLVVADRSASPSRVAAELIAQAEHDPEASVAAVSWQSDVLTAVRAELERQIEEAPRRNVIEAALASRGACLLADSRLEALTFAERYAAEHLALYTDDPHGDLENQRRAGTAFLGDCSSVAFGDYLTGANHVLPTAGRAGSFSGLSILDFLRFYTWQELTPEGAAAMAHDVERLAMSEGLPAHAAAARARATVAEDRT
jgi:histidinol dehydrogenase